MKNWYKIYHILPEWALSDEPLQKLMFLKLLFCQHYPIQATKFVFLYDDLTLIFSGD